jgi:hypothetical protein
LNGQVLVSQGEGLAPNWRSINVTFMEEGQYKLINSYLSSDQVGISTLSNGVAADGIYKNSVGNDIADVANGKWVKLPVLRIISPLKTEETGLLISSRQELK